MKKSSPGHKDLVGARALSLPCMDLEATLSLQYTDDASLGIANTLLHGLSSSEAFKGYFITTLWECTLPFMKSNEFMTKENVNNSDARLDIYKLQETLLAE